MSETTPSLEQQFAERIAKHLDDELVSFSACPDDFLPPQIEEMRKETLREVADYLAGQLRAYRKVVLEDAAFNLWRNGGAPPIKSTKTARAKDRKFALDYLRRLAGE